MKRQFALAVFAAALLLIPCVAAAAPLYGTFDSVGRADVRVGVDGTTLYIDWGQVAPPAPSTFNTPPGSGIGDIMFISGQGDFASLVGTNGTIKDLRNPPDAVGVPINVPNFITSAAHPSWNFTLQFIYPGSGTAAGCTNVAGAICTPFPTSPFTITNLTSSSSIVGLKVRGTVSDGTPGAVSIFTGTFSTQLDTMAALDVLTQIATRGFVQASESAQVTAVPEPASMLLLGTGLIGLGATARRRMRK